MTNYTFSALVIDDKFDEIKGFIDILNSNGIATYYLNFVESNTEKYLKNINNIRLIVTDLHDDKDFNNLNKINSTFFEIQEARINNFILIVWTKDPNKFDTFINEIKSKYAKDLNFIAIALSKEEFINLETYEFLDDKYEELSKKIREHIENNLFKYFLTWEVNINIKAAKIINKIVSSLDENNLKNIIATLTQEDKDNKQKELFKILSTILSDEIATLGKGNIELVDSRIDENLKARLNTTILFEKEPMRKINNGNIYLYDEFLDGNKKDDIGELVCGFKNELNNFEFEYVKKICSDELDIDVSQSDKKERCKEKFCEKVRKIIYDITPSCDIGRDKHINNRMLLGFLIPIKLVRLIKKSDYIIKYNFSFIFNDENYSIVLFSNRFFTINPKYIENLQPILRARKELSADIQQKVASHIARVGVFSLEDTR